MPYRFQHHYWHVIGPPLLLPLYFHYDNLRHVFKHKIWSDLFWMLLYLVKISVLYGPILGGWGTFWFYMFMRFLESHWFVYVTQMNHISMEIHRERYLDWPTLQTLTTCNVEKSWFNDWFTGHLNFQVEHHLFPTMPRHNYSKVNKQVREMYEKHGVPMVTKPLSTAMWDIVRCLQEYGNIWHEAYYG